MSAFTHITVGGNNLDKSSVFYDAILLPLGWSRKFTAKNAVGWELGEHSFFVFVPINGEPATHANGGTIGFGSPDRPSVDVWHANGLAAGGTCDGAPGTRRYSPHAYGAYLRDPDNNKLCIYCHESPE